MGGMSLGAAEEAANQQTGKQLEIDFPPEIQERRHCSYLRGILADWSG